MEYYNKTIKFCDLKYITRKNIDESLINVTSPEMYTEVQEYNSHMKRMQSKKVLFLADYWGSLGLYLISFALALVGILMFGTLSPVYWLTKNTILSVVCAAVIFVPIIILIFIRKIYSWQLNALLCLPASFVSLLFIINMVLGSVIIYIMNRIDSSMRDDVGYPHFVMLSATYFHEDDEDKDKPDEPKFSFDKFKSDFNKEDMDEI